MYQYKAQITGIISGDTIQATIDLGFSKQEIGNFRLFGIKANGEAAKGKLAEYVLGKEVMIQTVKSKKDAPLTAILYLPDDASSINDRLVATKYASRHIEEFKSLQNER